VVASYWDATAVTVQSLEASGRGWSVANGASCTVSVSAVLIFGANPRRPNATPANTWSAEEAGLVSSIAQRANEADGMGGSAVVSGATVAGRIATMAMASGLATRPIGGQASAAARNRAVEVVDERFGHRQCGILTALREGRRGLGRHIRCFAQRADGLRGIVMKLRARSPILVGQILTASLDPVDASRLVVRDERGGDIGVMRIEAAALHYEIIASTPEESAAIRSALAPRDRRGERRFPHSG
jgi:hypothetical protein